MAEYIPQQRVGIVPKRKPQDFSTLKDPQKQRVVNNLARANVKIVEDSKLRVHVQRATRMMIIDDVLLPALCEQGVVDIIKEMAIQHTVDLDGICEECYIASKCNEPGAFYDVRHPGCIRKLISAAAKECDECKKRLIAFKHPECFWANLQEIWVNLGIFE